MSGEFLDKDLLSEAKEIVPKTK